MSVVKQNESIFRKPLKDPTLDILSIKRKEDIPEDAFDASLDNQLFQSIVNEFEKGNITRDYRFDVAVDSKLRKHLEKLVSPCLCSEHNAPTKNLKVPYGFKYVHVCPECKERQVILHHYISTD